MTSQTTSPRPPLWRRPGLWLGLSIGFAVLVPITFMLATVTASAAQGPCGGAFSVFHELARCRWPAIFGKASFGCIVGLGVAIGMAIWTRRAAR